MPVAAAIPWIVGGISAAATVYSAVKTKKAEDQAADTERAVAGYNAKIDRSEQRQIELDTTANIASLRKDASVYMSRQRTAYAGAGVRVDSGSPLAVRAATAGAAELKAQELRRQSAAQIEGLESQAQAGLLYGESAAVAHTQAGSAAIMSGAARLAGQVYGAHNDGMFSSSPKPYTYSSGRMPPTAVDAPRGSVNPLRLYG